MKITVKYLDKPDAFKKWVTTAFTKDAENIVERLATLVEQAIKIHIMSTSRLPTGALADAFFKEQLSPTSWGIGDIATLNKNTPYWRHINYGSIAIGADWQHFLPKGFWNNGRWNENQAGYAGVKPKNPIQAHNYIEKTLVDLDIAIQKTLSEK